MTTETPPRRFSDRPRTEVNTGRCAICNTSRALTGTGQLYPLAVRGPLRDYLRYICEDCVNLFNTTHWTRVKKLLRKAFRPRRYGIARAPEALGLNEKLAAIETLCSAKENSATAQQVMAILWDYEFDPVAQPLRVRNQL